VFGILRVTTTERTAWTAGHLKLITSLAANAAAAISHAMLHRDRLRQQALRHQIERFVSADVLDAAVGQAGATHERAAAALFCDASELTHHADPNIAADQLMELVLRATTRCASVLIRHGATVQISQGELIVALFVASDEQLRSAADAAVRAATEITQVLDRRFGGFGEHPPSIAITCVKLPAVDAAPAFFAAVGAAATLHEIAQGRILLDEHIASALGDQLRASVAETRDGAVAASRMYEVRV
jgi:hypothetical protein